MSFFSRLRLWQKGLAAGVVFTAGLALVHTLVLIAMDLLLEMAGAPHSCTFVGEDCSLVQALVSRIGFFFFVLAVFGLPLGALGAAVGLLIDKVRVRP